MAEDMTYPPVQYREVQELKARIRQLQLDNVELQEKVAGAQKKLAAVPEYAIEYGDCLLNNARHAPPTFDEWLKSYQGVQA